MSEAETQLEDLGAKKTALEAELSDPDLYSGDSERVRALHQSKKALEDEIARVEARWVEAGEALDEALSLEQDR